MTSSPRVPELRAGDRLTRDEFERRFAAMPEVKKADLLLRLPPAAGGGSHVGAAGYLEGPPELVIEVAASSTSYDLHQKLGAYRRNGVREYLVHRVEDGEVDWFQLENGAFVRQLPDANGCLHSRAFPGLCLDVAGLLRNDPPALRGTVERSVATPEPAALVDRLASSAGGA